MSQANPPNRYDYLNVDDPMFAVIAVDAILSDAIAVGASDVHLHPGVKQWDVLMRIDGVLTPVGQLDRRGENDPVTRMMVLAGLPTYRANQPMEGRLSWPQQDSPSQIPSRPPSDVSSRAADVSMRLGVFPTVHGTRAVVRLLRKSDRFDSLDSLGLSDDVRDALVAMTDRTDGAILLAGPAGSGKTTTLYAMLRRIATATPRRSVVTIEDPVESLIDSISQSELSGAGAMSLAAALKSAVRQDSEVLLVSEIRDPETAHALVQASLTGHLVFSSLHAGDIPSALRRMVQMGVPHHAVRSGVGAIVCQRLLRRLCPDCERGKSERRQSERRQCEKCSDTGYHGRFPVATCVTLDGNDPVGDALAESLERGDSLSEMRRVFTEADEQGRADLRVRASEWVAAGWTDQNEVYRVLGRS